jgi:8-oxo-dGTP diphosphatase
LTYNGPEVRSHVPQYPPGPALTADAVWVDRGRVLLVRRGRPPFRGRWALPGGFVELRETVEAAVERELLEETGLRGRAIDLVGVYSGPDRDPRKPTTTVAYLIRGRAGRPTPGDDAGGAAWVPVGATGPLAFDHSEILRDALRLLRRRRPNPRRRARRGAPRGRASG